MTDNIKRKSSDKKNLPAPYVSPWFSLEQNIKSILADICLRINKIFPFTNKFNVLSPSFIPRWAANFFWPLILFSLLLLIALIVLQLFMSLIHINPFSQFYLPSSESSLSEPIIKITTPNQSSNILQLDNSQPLSEIKSKLELLPSKVDPLIISILEQNNFSDNIDEDLIQAGDTTSLDNGVLLRLTSDWAMIDLSQKKLFLQDLLDLFVRFGYGDLQVYDHDGFIIARKSVLAKEMVIFDQI